MSQIHILAINGASLILSDKQNELKDAFYIHLRLKVVLGYSAFLMCEGDL